MRRRAFLALVVANVIWGAASPIFKWSLTNITPFTLALLRFGLAALILIPFIYRSSVKIKQKDWPLIFLFAFCGVTFNISFFFWGLRLAPSINASIISTIQPLILLIIGAIWLKENVQKIEVLGTIVSFLGISLIILYPFLTNGQKGEIASLGNLFFFMATLGAVGQTILGKQLFKTYDSPLLLSFYAFAIGALTFFPFFLWEWWQKPDWLGQLQISGWVGIIYGVIFSSALAYSLYHWALSKIEASETGIFTYLMPITAILIAVPFFGEKITLPFIIGTLLVALGIFLTERRLPYHPLHKRRE